MSDLIDRQAAIDEAEEWIKTYNSGRGGQREQDAIKHVISGIKNLPSAQPERWIPCSERLPEEDVEVLITYRYKEGEGDTSHADIDITTYGQMYFGGNKVGNHKHWRQPFECFESNYEVVAWMPLPEPYKTESDGEK